MRVQSLLPLLLCAALLPFGGCGENGGEDQVPTLRFSAIPSDSDQTGYVARFAKVAEHLSKELGIPVAYQHAATYAQARELFVQEDVLLAWFGGLSGAQARHKVQGARAICQGDADPNFYSYFIAHKDTGLTRGDEFPAGIAGRTFTFGSKGSTSGRLMPEHFIRTLGGKAPTDYFKSVAYSGAHNTTALQVQGGSAEVGALSYKTYDAMVAKGEIDPEVCRVIWKTPTYPDYNMTAHPRIDEIYGKGTIDRIQAAVLAMTGEELMEGPFQRTRMIEAKNEDFAPIHELASQLGLLD